VGRVLSSGGGWAVSRCFCWHKGHVSHKGFTGLLVARGVAVAGTVAGRGARDMGNHRGREAAPVVGRAGRTGSRSAAVERKVGIPVGRRRATAAAGDRAHRGCVPGARDPRGVEAREHPRRVAADLPGAEPIDDRPQRGRNPDIIFAPLRELPGVAPLRSSTQESRKGVWPASAAFRRDPRAVTVTVGQRGALPRGVNIPPPRSRWLGGQRVAS